MIAAQQIFLGRGGAKLPYDAEVEWIQTGNGAWLDTLVTPNDDTIVQFRGYRMSQAPYVVVGFYDGMQADADDADWRLIVVTDIYFDWGDARVSRTGVVRWETYSWRNFELGNFYVKDLDSNVVLLSGNRQSFVFNNNITLAHGVDVGGSVDATIRFSYCKIYNAGVLVRDFIPVRFVNELGNTEGAMYDRVSGALFRNAGTGAFLYGNDITANSNGGGRKCLNYSSFLRWRSRHVWKEAA